MIHHGWEDIGDVITSFFSNLFQLSNPQQVENIAKLVEGRVDQDMHEFLEKDLSSNEVYDVLQQIH